MASSDTLQSGSLQIASRLRIEALSPEHAAQLFVCVDENRGYLRRWLLWLDNMRDVTDSEAFIAGEVEKRSLGTAATYAVIWDDRVCGAAGFRTLDTTAGVGEVGYWLAEAYTGKGLITRVVRSLIKQGSDVYGLQRIEIHCATGNLASRGVAESVGAKLARIDKDAAYLHDHYVDHAIYVWENDKAAVVR